MKRSAAVALGTALLATCGQGDKDPRILASGHVEATEVLISTKVAGTLEHLAIDEGSTVEAGLEIANGSAVIATLPKVDDAYDLGKLSELVMSLKRDYPNTDDASVLLEPEIEYDHLIQVMDVVRSAEQPGGEGEEPVRVALFTDIAIGDAP